MVYSNSCGITLATSKKSFVILDLQCLATRLAWRRAVVNAYLIARVSFDLRCEVK